VQQKDAENYLNQVVNKNKGDFVRAGDNDYNPALFTSDNKHLWSPDTKIFGPDEIHPKQISPNEIAEPIAREQQAAVLNRAYENWMKQKEADTTEYNNELSNISEYTKKAMADGSLSPQESAEIAKMNEKLNSIKPDDIFDQKDAVNSLNKEFNRDADILKAQETLKQNNLDAQTAKKLRNFIQQKTVDLDTLTPFKERMAQQQTEALPASIDAAKNLGLGKALLGNNPQQSFSILQDLKNRGALPPELQPLYNQLSGYKLGA
jgi:hypothetical protein